MSSQQSEEYFRNEFKKRSVIPTELKVVESTKGLSRREKIVDSIASILKVETTIKKSKSVVPTYIFDSDPQIRRPETDLFSLVLMATNSWPVRRTFNAIIKEATKNWGHVEPRFKVKCKNCGQEYQHEVTECECGAKGNRLKKPNIKQRRKLVNLTTMPSRDRDFREFVRTSMFYILATDENYWSIIYKPKKVLEYFTNRRESNLAPSEVFNEHPGFMYPVGDKFGFLGGYEYFCPRCFNKPEYSGHDEPKVDIRELIKQSNGRVPEIIRCPDCGLPMVQTYYVQEIGGEVTARFGKKEIIHTSISRLAPELFGTPRLSTLVKLIKSVQAVDDYQLETNAEGKVGGLLGFPGLDQDRVGEILAEVKKERETLSKRDIVTGNLESSKRTALIFIGLGEEGGNPIKIPFLDKEDIEFTLRFYQMYLNAIDEIYGCHSLTEVVDIGGKSTKEVRTKVEVTKDTARELQGHFSFPFNEKLLPMYGITDYVWVFDKLEPKDQLREADILHQKAASAKIFVDAGFKTKIKDGEVEVEGEVDPEKIKQEERAYQEKQAELRYQRFMENQETRQHQFSKPGEKKPKGAESHRGQPNKEPGVTPARMREDHRGTTRESDRTGELIQD